MLRLVETMVDFSTKTTTVDDVLAAWKGAMTLQELRDEAVARGLKVEEISIFDDHPYNPGKLGWLLRVSGGPRTVEVFAPHLTTAYHKLLYV